MESMLGSRRRRSKKEISVLHWLFRNNSLPPSSPRSFRTQSHSLILHYRTMSLFRTVSSSTFITLEVQSIYIPSSIQEWYWEVTIWEEDRRYSFCGSNEQGTQRSWDDLLGSTASCTVHAYSMAETSKHGVLGGHRTCSKERIKVLSNAIERHYPVLYTPSLLYPESCPDGNSRSHIRKNLNHFDRLRRFPWEMIGWRNWVQKLFDKQKTTNQPNQTLIQFTERSDPLWQNKRPVRVLRKLIHVSLLTARKPICL